MHTCTDASTVLAILTLATFDSLLASYLQQNVISKIPSHKILSVNFFERKIHAFSKVAHAYYFRNLFNFILLNKRLEPSSTSPYSGTTRKVRPTNTFTWKLIVNKICFIAMYNIFGLFFVGFISVFPYNSLFQNINAAYLDAFF